MLLCLICLGLAHLGKPSRSLTAWTAAGYGPITTEIADLDAFYYAEEYHQQYLDKIPNGYCPNHATGVRFPDVAATPLRYVD